jgi:hypothetical protein
MEYLIVALVGMAIGSTGALIGAYLAVKTGEVDHVL